MNSFPKNLLNNKEDYFKKKLFNLVLGINALWKFLSVKMDSDYILKETMPVKYVGHMSVCT